LAVHRFIIDLSNIGKYKNCFQARWLKSGSFGFAKRWLVCRTKPNVPLVRLAKIVFKKCGSAKKIKHEALGCRVGKKSAVKFICHLVVSLIVC
jgi:hypothetical protein